MMYRLHSHYLRYFPACLIGLSATVFAQAPAPTLTPTPTPTQMPSAPEAAAVLQRISNAARELSYAGVFVHSTQDRTAASRITHISSRGDEWEKIESLDGPAHEIIRRNEQLFCYQPESKTVRLDRRISGKFFPSLLHGTPQAILENYNVRMGATERISGHDCQWITLEPKDTLRFLQRLCAEIGSGLLLRAKVFNDRNQMLEQFTFTELRLGKEAARDFGHGHIKSHLQEKLAGWMTDDSAQRDMKNTDSGWVAASPPQGFRKVMEMKRTLAGKALPVSHLVFSDGLASISVFVEALNGGVQGQSKGAEDGMFSYALRTVADHQVTVLGEVPFGAAQMLANSMEPKIH